MICYYSGLVVVNVGDIRMGKSVGLYKPGASTWVKLVIFPFDGYHIFQESGRTTEEYYKIRHIKATTGGQ